MNTSKDSAVIIFEGTDQLIEQTIAELKKSTITDEALAALKDQYSGMTIVGIEDMKGYKAVKAAVTQLRGLRTSVESRRKELTEPALKFQREVKAEADRITAEIKPLEDALKQKVVDIDDAREAARKAEYQRRLTLLTECGYQLVNGFLACGPVSFLTDDLTDLTDEQMAYHESHGRGELARIEAEDLRKKEEAEAQRIEGERLQKEREEIAAERAELARLRAENEAQKAALEKTYETVVQPEQPVSPIEFDMPKAFVPDPNDPTRQAPIAPDPNPHPLNPKSVLEGAITKEEPTGPVWMPANEYERGFNAFRVKLVALVNDPNSRLTRALLTEWAWNLPPTDTKK